MDSRSAKVVFLILVPLLLYWMPLPFVPLMEPDEARYSLIPSAMNATGDYITPRLKGVVYFEKPPLAYWATAVFFGIFGENAFSARLFAALCAWGCILLAYRMGSHFHDSKTGIYAAAIFSTSLFPWAIGRLSILDMPLAFFVSCAIWSGFRYFSSPERPRMRRNLLYLFSALAFLAKGLIGVAFPFGVLTLWLLVSGRWRELPGLLSPVGLLLFSAVSLPWLILVQRENPDFFRFFFIQEHLLRYTTRIHQRYEPFYFYLPIVAAGTLPWSAFLPGVFRRLGRSAASLFGPVEIRFLPSWCGLILLFYSVSSSKLVPYIAPIFLPLALLLAPLFRRYDETEADGGADSGSSCTVATTILLAVLFAAILLAPMIPHKYQVRWGEWWPWIAVPMTLLPMTLLLHGWIRKRTGLGRFLSLSLPFALLLAALAFPAARYLAPYKSALPLSRAILAHLPPGVEVYQYGVSLYGIDFYTGKRTPIVDDIGELQYGSLQLPPQERERYFLSSDSFFRRVRESEEVYCVTKSGERLERLKKEFPDLRVLWHKKNQYLLQLKRS